MKNPKILQSTTDFVLWLEKNYNDKQFPEPFSLCVINYAKLIRKPLELGMFLPMNDGEVLNEPEKYKDWLKEPVNNGHYPIGVRCEQYNKAYKAILFEGWTFGNSESDGCYLSSKKRINSAFWDSRHSEFDLQIGGGFNHMENIEQLINEMELIGTDTFWGRTY